MGAAEKSQLPMPNRRRFKRAPFTQQVGVLYRGRFHIERGAEISEGGMLVAISTPLPVGARIELSLLIPGGGFGTVQGQVVYNLERNGADHIGIRFIRPPKKMQAEIERYVASL